MKENMIGKYLIAVIFYFPTPNVILRVNFYYRDQNF